MLNNNEKEKCTYPKIETLFDRFDRNKRFKVNTEVLRMPEYKLIKEWQVTEKINGTNVSIIWKNGELQFLGRTHVEPVPAEHLALLKETIQPEHMFNIFGNKEVVLYGEGYGHTIRNTIPLGQTYSETPKFILFDILINNFWLERENIENIAQRLGIKAVPVLGHFCIEEIVNMVSQGFPSSEGNIKVCEGIVAKTTPGLFDRKGHRLMFKLKHTDF